MKVRDKNKGGIHGSVWNEEKEGIDVESKLLSQKQMESIDGVHNRKASNPDRVKFMCAFDVTSRSLWEIQGQEIFFKFSSVRFINLS